MTCNSCRSEKIKKVQESYIEPETLKKKRYIYYICLECKHIQEAHVE